MIKKFSLMIVFFFLPFAVVWAESSLDTVGRIEWIKTKLNQAQGPAHTWQYGWGTAYGAGTYLYTAQAVTFDDDDEDHDRFDAGVNAATSFLGFLSMVLDPLTTGQQNTELDKLPMTSDQEKEAALQAWETRLEKCARREKQGRSWKTHLLSGLVSVAAGVAVACDGSREEDGLTMFAGSLLVSEIQIFTQPMGALRAWEAYQNGAWNQAGTVSSGYRFFVTLSPEGIVLNYPF